MSDVLLISNVIAPSDVRRFAGLPSEVPDTLLTTHIAVALRELKRRVGVEGLGAASPLTEAWKEALTVKALASAYPWFNSFALDGAAKVGRLEGAVEYRFLDASETDARIERLDERFDVLVSEIRIGLSPPGDNEISVDSGAMSMMAI